jgi:hypothetical protein
MDMPPSTVSVAPVMSELSSLAYQVKALSGAGEGRHAG